MRKIIGRHIVKVYEDEAPHAFDEDDYEPHDPFTEAVKEALQRIDEVERASRRYMWVGVGLLVAWAAVIVWATLQLTEGAR